MVYTINDIANRWGADRNTVKREMEEGRLRYFTYGSMKKPRYRIRKEWLDEFEERNRGGETE